MKKLRICEFNLENLFISLAYYSGQNLQLVSEKEWQSFALAQMQVKQKPLAKVFDLAKAILDIDPDVAMLVEVGGEESLDHFNRLFLAERYVLYFVEGNSRRGIDLGFLVKKELGFQVDLRSHRHMPIEILSWNKKIVSRFNRDVAELRLSNQDGLWMILLLVHLKSQLSTEADYKGKDTRLAEATALVKIYQDLRQQFPKVPIVIGGDFNADLRSLELEILKSTDLSDFRDVVEIPEEQRYSLIYFDFGGRAYPLILDHLLVSPHLKDRIVKKESFIYRYKGFYNIPLDRPKSEAERYRMPSDHYPLVLTLKTENGSL